MKEKQSAPGELEQVRAFLNSWRIPNTTRIPTDLLQIPQEVEKLLASSFPQLTNPGDLEAARQLRSDLRAMLGTHEVDITALNAWLKRYPVLVVLEQNKEKTTIVRYQPQEPDQGLCQAVLPIVVQAINQGIWQRLKACQDCQWIFYDHTKNTGRIWCGMLAYGPQGRACGSIAKVRSYRQRQKMKSHPEI